MERPTTWPGRDVSPLGSDAHRWFTPDSDVGSDSGTPVTDDLEGGETKFSGRVRWVQIDIDEAGQNLDHLITPEERLRIAMTRQ